MIGTIENAIIERLKLAGEQGVLGYVYRHLETYPEDWQAYWDSTASKAVNYPAGWATFGGLRTLQQYNSGSLVEASYGLILAAKSYRNQTAARAGDQTGAVGSYQLAVDAIGLLENHTLGLPIGGIELVSVQFVTLTEAQRKLGLSMMVVQLRTRFKTTSRYFEPQLEFLGDFETFAAKWDQPPVTGTDLEQTITLPITEEAPVA